VYTQYVQRHKHLPDRRPPDVPPDHGADPGAHRRRRLAAGKELPSIRALAAALNVSVITIKRAYLDLETEGVIVTRHGKGSFVADVNGLAGELQEAKLDEHLAEAAQIGRQLGLSEEDLAARLRRVHRNLDKK
jgi:GntR family transcriptional regulator